MVEVSQRYTKKHKLSEVCEFHMFNYGQSQSLNQGLNFRFLFSFNQYTLKRKKEQKANPCRVCK